MLFKKITDLQWNQPARKCGFSLSAACEQEEKNNKGGVSLSCELAGQGHKIRDQQSLRGVRHP